MNTDTLITIAKIAVVTAFKATITVTVGYHVRKRLVARDAKRAAIKAAEKSAN